jgi:hypothetical protein
VTKCLRQTTEREERLILTHSFRGFGPSLAGYGKAEHHGGSVWWSKVAPVMVAGREERERQRERKGSGTRYPFRVTSSVTYFLKLSTTS